jgi:hypothetical protein
LGALARENEGDFFAHKLRGGATMSPRRVS